VFLELFQIFQGSFFLEIIANSDDWIDGNHGSHTIHSPEEIYDEKKSLSIIESND